MFECWINVVDGGPALSYCRTCTSSKLTLGQFSINHIMSIYDLNKFQVSNYDSWITIKNTIINVSEPKVKNES